MKGGALTGVQVRESGLTSVPSTASADLARRAGEVQQAASAQRAGSATQAIRAAEVERATSADLADRTPTAESATLARHAGRTEKLGGRSLDGFLPRACQRGAVKGTITVQGRGAAAQPLVSGARMCNGMTPTATIFVNAGNLELGRFAVVFPGMSQFEHTLVASAPGLNTYIRVAPRPGLPDQLVVELRSLASGVLLPNEVFSITVV